MSSFDIAQLNVGRAVERLSPPNTVLWWPPAGTLPSVAAPPARQRPAVSPAYASVVRRSEIQALIGYLYWLRDRVVTAADQAGVEAFRAARLGASRDLRATLVHELDFETSWRRRLMGADETDLDPADYPTLDTIADYWRHRRLTRRTRRFRSGTTSCTR